MSIETRKVDEIVWREDLYPRIEPSPAVIQRYAEILEVLPSIEINQRNELIDGYHRWTAHRKAEAKEIRVGITETSSDLETRALAIKRNAQHGLQLDERSKKREAIWLYGAGAGLDKAAIADVLSVSTRMVNNYLSDIDKQLRKERKEKIRAAWLECQTHQEIADEVGISRTAVTDEIQSFVNFGSVAKSDKTLALYDDGAFTPPLYNVWSYAAKTNAVGHFGNSEQRILENLLYLYTEPFDVVLDPFAGGGSTIDVCKRRLRRYWVSDLRPIVERENEIRQLDIVRDLPLMGNRWSDVTLTYLDPPYWKQAEGKYSDSPDDLANMSLDEFNAALSGVISRIYGKQSRGAIALLIQPTQWNAPGRDVVDHIIDIIGALDYPGLKLEYRISCPYSTEQYNPQQVEWAKENKKLLLLTRELIVWKVA
jgi:predicted DNA-binding protein YlxM (UPF0122 family)